jgi:PTH2 family peptidyl-tRNA hydrolase
MSDTCEYKQVMVVRKDLNLGCGKIASQVAHGSLGSYEECKKRKPEWVESWKLSRWKKIVAKVNSYDEITRLIEQASRMDVPYFLVFDAGLTQVTPGTLTCVGLGPAPSNIMDRLTGDLKLL